MAKRRRPNVALWLYGSAISAFLAGRNAFPDAEFPPSAALNSALPLLLKPAPVLAALALLRRRPLLALALAYPAYIALRKYGPNFVRLLRPAPDAEADLRVLTFNIHKEAEGIDKMINLIRAADADVVMLQEVSAPAVKRIKTILEPTFPHQTYYVNTDYASAGMGISSRFPLENAEYWRNRDIPNALGNQRAEITLRARKIALYNVHPVHPGMVGETWNANYRAKEIDLLLARIEADIASGLAVLCAGDFNLTDQSDDYRKLNSLLIDAFQTVGAGFGYTFPDWLLPKSRPEQVNFPMPIPLARLDYVFTAGLRPLSAQVWPTSAGSDHRPLYARVAIAE